MKNKLKLLYWLPAVVMMLLIFQFSTANGEQSSGLSLGLTQKIIDTVTSVANIDLTPGEKLSMIEAIHGPVRKLGHLTEYALFAITVAFPLYTFHQKRRWNLLFWCEGICILYACSDEFHQLFVPERSGQITDVLIDSIGITFGLLIFFLFLKIYNRYKPK
ncbi:VanZ family protein [Anaerocolumna sp. MB42-C2]|uniref:VanZ family protein n=1 Tax=Anaerocolumna sp. MB42-C2 TaxID=3070997 RepID=UPI0027E030C9|nr:VanZ family protein [Anaerocolumna sp. MB42-C2]WMJ85888.1 VanZ family protein [Anaerocolumna sp. MB42-C2]